MLEGAILVVDDAKANRDMLARRLTREGYRVLTAESGPEALAITAQQEICLILLDLMMPVMSGLEVLEELRKTRGDRELPVLMVSANTDAPQMVSSIDLGANDYVTKPIDFDLLLAKVRRHLNVRQGPRPLRGGGNEAGGSGTPLSAPIPAAAPLEPAPKPAATRTDPPQPGEMLGHYRLDSLLGVGGMGQVFLAQDTRLLRQVAIKILVSSPGKSLTQESLDRFMLEARAVARVSHPGVVTIFEVATEPRNYIAMELLKGRDLGRISGGRPMDPARAVNLVTQVLEALQVVHDLGIIHRDLKPSNIMVSTGDRVKVLDFGLAKLEDNDQKLTQTGQIWGTPQYMAPEQLDLDFGALDCQTDIFAVASIFYELLTGVPTFSGDTISKLIYQIVSKEPIPPHDVNPALSAQLSQIALKGLHKKKARRYLSCREFLDALRMDSGLPRP